MLTEKTREKISRALIKAHREGRHPGWEHINTDPERRSYPEKFFLKGLTLNGVTELYTIVEQLPINKYFLDFALIDLKIDIEIDGCQHTRNQKAIKHDEIRDRYLRDSGWIIYRISWTELKDNPDLIFDELREFLAKKDEKSDRYYEISEVRLKVDKRKYGNNAYSHKMRRVEYIKKEQERIELVISSDIDFSKFGWVSKLSKIIDKKPQKVNKWMKDIMPEFYESNCFKRKKIG